MTKRLWVFLGAFVAAASVGLFGPTYIARRRAELEVRAWCRSAQDEVSLSTEDEDPENTARVRALLGDLEAFAEASPELGLDGFPVRSLTRFLEEGELAPEVRERDVAATLERLDALLHASPEREALLASDSYRVPGVARPATVRAIRVSPKGFRVASALSIVTAVNAPSGDKAAARLGDALDLARVVDSGVLARGRVREAVESEVYEAVHHLLRARAFEPAVLLEGLATRLARNAHPDLASSLRGERRYLVEAFEVFLDRARLCAGFTGDFRPIEGVVRSLEESSVLAELPPEGLLARLSGDSGEERSTYEEYLVDMHTHLALGRMLHALLQIAAHREREGEWPGELAQLEPRVVLDPHTQASFVYEVRDGACRLGPPAIARLLPRGAELVRILE